jgi:hypothetical protein
MGKRDPKCTAPGCRFEAVGEQGVCLRHGGIARTRPVGNAPIDAPGMRLCGATTRVGGRCKQPAIRGAARCRKHGGSAPQVRRKAAEIVAEASLMEVARQYGVPRDVSPIDALTEELHRTQGRVDFLDREMAARPNDPNLLAVYTAERSHLAKLADAMVRAKLDERRAVLKEQGLDAVETALVGTLRELGLDPSSDRIRQMFARHLRAASQGQKVSGRPQIVDAVIVSDQAAPEPADF